MTTSELHQALVRLGAPADDYSLTGGLPNEAYCLAGTGAGWEVYYSERGEKKRIASFENESEACLFFLALIKRDVLPYG